MYELSREIPKHTKTVKIREAKKDFTPMSDRYRAIREKSKHPMCSCFWCGHKFGNGEMMGLALMHKALNEVICGTCFDAMQEIEEGEDKP